MNIYIIEWTEKGKRKGKPKNHWQFTESDGFYLKRKDAEKKCSELKKIHPHISTRIVKFVKEVEG